jgi:hypothetical protein
MDEIGDGGEEREKRRGREVDGVVCVCVCGGCGLIGWLWAKYSAIVYSVPLEGRIPSWYLFHAFQFVTYPILFTEAVLCIYRCGSPAATSVLVLVDR